VLQIQLINPNPTLAKSAGLIGNATIGTAREPHETRRRLTENIKGNPSLAFIAATNLNPQIAASQGNRWLSYYGRPYRIPYELAEDVINSTNRSSTNDLAGRTVFIGAHTDWRPPDSEGDYVDTPYRRFGKGESMMRSMPGVEVHATAFANLTNDDWLRTPSDPLTRIIIIIFGALAAVILRLIPSRAILGMGLLCLAFLFWLGPGGGAGEKVWWPWLVCAIQVPVAALWASTGAEPFTAIKIKILRNAIQGRNWAFISFRTETGKTIAGRLGNLLEKNGTSCFYSPGKMEAGKFMEQLAGEIKNAPVLIFMYTSGALESLYVQFELEEARQRKKIIIPVARDSDMPPQKAPSNFAWLWELDWIYIEHLNDEEFISRIISRGIDAPGNWKTGARK
jgi:hypothetical protein